MRRKRRGHLTAVLLTGLLLTGLPASPAGEPGPYLRAGSFEGHEYFLVGLGRESGEWVVDPMTFEECRDAAGFFGSLRNRPAHPATITSWQEQKYLSCHVNGFWWGRSDPPPGVPDAWLGLEKRADADWQWLPPDNQTMPYELWCSGASSDSEDTVYGLFGVRAGGDGCWGSDSSSPTDPTGTHRHKCLIEVEPPGGGSANYSLERIELWQSSLCYEFERGASDWSLCSQPRGGEPAVPEIVIQKPLLVRAIGAGGEELDAELRIRLDFHPCSLQVPPSVGSPAFSCACDFVRSPSANGPKVVPASQTPAPALQADAELQESLNVVFLFTAGTEHWSPYLEVEINPSSRPPTPPWAAGPNATYDQVPESDYSDNALTTGGFEIVGKFLSLRYLWIDLIGKGVWPTPAAIAQVSDPRQFSPERRSFPLAGIHGISLNELDTDLSLGRTTTCEAKPNPNDPYKGIGVEIVTTEWTLIGGGTHPVLRVAPRFPQQLNAAHVLCAMGDLRRLLVQEKVLRDQELLYGFVEPEALGSSSSQHLDIQGGADEDDRVGWSKLAPGRYAGMVFAHEVGHLVGLEHSDLSAACNEEKGCKGATLPADCTSLAYENAVDIWLDLAPDNWTADVRLVPQGTCDMMLSNGSCCAAALEQGGWINSADQAEILNSPCRLFPCEGGAVP